MKSMKLKAVTLGVGAALVASLGTAQAATVTECRALVGYNSSYAAWGAVQNNSRSFIANNRVASCEVKVVLPSSKGGKPATTTLTIEREMTRDECSMYNYLSSIDSKLDQAKVGDAYVIVSDMLAKLNNLFYTGKLEQLGYEALTQAVTPVQSCISELMSQ
ncbi:MAG: hypothetical protein OEW90_10790 [Betaproteobacteria bacterium]|nr:hypothetical protein [Betaproteobacteria bacterium]MDH4324613.1 hypothetical protein [Betaproteobacteria bacterium]